jgi:Fe(3+) dicitrate transport protein
MPPVIATRLAVFVALVLAIAPPLARAQTAPAPVVSGRILDTTGSVVVGAAVTVRRPSGMLIGTATTGASGEYRLASLDIGRVTITATSDGFSLSEVELTLRGGEQRSLDLVLRPGGFVEELTVIGGRLVGSEEMRRRVAGAFDIVDHDTLRASHVFTTSEALRKVPGVTARDEEGFGLRPNIGVRGLNPTRSTKVLLLEDGLPVSYAPYGDNASYYHPPIERFDRVEVLKGSSQIAHGPVTLGGVINYITPDAPLRRSISVDLAGGNRAYGQAGASFGQTWKRTGVFAHVQRKQGDGARENLHSDLNDLMFKVSHAFGSTQQITGKVNYYGERSQVTYSGLRADEYAADPRQNPFANDDFHGDRWGLSGTYRALVASRVALTASGYSASFARDWWRQSSNSAQRPNDSADPQCAGMANLNTTCGNEGRLRNYRHTGGEVRARVDTRHGVPVETDFGFRAHTENQDRQQQNGASPAARAGVLVEDNERTTDAVAAFVQQRWLFGSLTLTPGARVEHVDYTRTNRLLAASGETALTEIVPGVGVAYAAGAHSTIFAGAHKGFAPPRAEDIINNSTGGVVELDPERSWNYEFGGRTRLGPAQFDATLFRLDYENQVVPASVAGGVGAVLTNGGETLHQGVEVGINADWRALRQSASDLYARLAYTWLPVAEFTGVRTSAIAGFTSVSVSGNRLPYAPESLTTLTLGYRHAVGLDVQIEAQHVGEQFGDDLNTVAGTADGQRGLLPAYIYWNLAATWRMPRLPGSVFLAIKNLDGRTFIVDRTRGILPGHPRLVHVGTSWRF